MNVSVENDDLVIRIPVWSERCNPYMQEEDYPLIDGVRVRPKYKSLVGCVKKTGEDQYTCGFGHASDMDYKGKPDQFCGFQVIWREYAGKEKVEEFEKLCTSLKLDIHYLNSDPEDDAPPF